MLIVRRPVGRLLFWMLLMVMAAVSEPRVLGATPATTTVSDVIYRGDGTPAQGTLLISWPAFSTKRGEPVAAGSKSVKIGAAGAVNIPLVPNTGATPTGTHYTVILKLADGGTSTEFWTVPDAGTATVAAIRSKIVPATAAAQFVARDYVDSALAGLTGDFVVHKNGAETITGAKTFAIAPVVPPPSEDGEAANKAYVDASLRTVSTNTAAVALNPTASQAVSQPNGTSLQVNRLSVASMNGIRYADQFGSLQEALTDAGSLGALVIPPGYAAGDTFTNQKGVPVLDLRGAGTARGGEISVKDFGAKGDAKTYSSCSIASGSKTLTAAAANRWAASDVGKRIRVTGAGAGGADLVSTIAAFTDGQHITLADAAGTAVTGRGAVWGTSIDDSAAVQAAVNAAIAAGGGTVKFPQGMYPLGSTITIQSSNSGLVQSVRMIGMGGMKATMLLWTGADGGDVIREGATADASKAMSVTVENFGFESLDSQNKGKKAGAFVNLYFGMMHHVTRNWFGVAVNHVKGRGFYLSKFDHNWWYGATASCLFTPNDDTQASVNGNFVVFNEFGACGRYAIENLSMGAGGSNQNVYAFNDFEQAIPGALGTLYLIDNASQVLANRFEDLTALSAEFRELTLGGGSNKVAFNQFGAAAPMQYAVTLLAGSQGNLFMGNNYTGNGASGQLEVQTGAAGNRSVGEDLRRGAVGGAGASSFDIQNKSRPTGRRTINIASLTCH